jgi:hypothetical protein
MEIITVCPSGGTVQIQGGPEFQAVLITVCIPVDEADDCDSNQDKRDAIAEAIGDAARGALVVTVVLTAASYQAAASAVSAASDGTLWGVSVVAAERDVAVVTFVTRDADALTAEALSRGWSA